jgi:hypothetical protein
MRLSINRSPEIGNVHGQEREVGSGGTIRVYMQPDGARANPYDREALGFHGRSGSMSEMEIFQQLSRPEKPNG